MTNNAADYQPNIVPVKFAPQVEHLEKDEKETIAKLLETMRQTREKTFEDTGHAMRSVHVKSHGLLTGRFEVLSDLPEMLKQGLFAKPASYPLVMRLSTTPSDMMTDKVSTPRGCAIKVMGVEGERLDGSEDDTTQDFVMVNNDKAFQVANLKRFLATFKPLAATTDKGERAKTAVSAVLRVVEKVVEGVGGSSAKIKNLGGEPENHILGESFFSQVPLRFGDFIAKVGFVPVSDGLKALTKKPLDAGRDPLALRHAVIDHFSTQGGEWELCVQLCTDLDKMPVEDASIVWPEEYCPYMAVARVIIAPQTAWSEERSKAVDDGMSFSPWHGLAAHRPLGSLMRARKAAYELSARFRTQNNSTSVSEPVSLDGFPN